MNTRMTARMSGLRALVGVFASGVLVCGLAACSSSSSEEEAMSSDSSTDTTTSENTARVVEPEETDTTTEQEVEEPEAEERSYEELIDRYMALSVEADAEKIYDELYLEELIDSIANVTTGGYDQLVDSLQSVLDANFSTNDLFYGSGWSITHDIASAESIEASSRAELMYRSIGFDIEELKEIQIDRSITSSAGVVTDADPATVYAVKIDNSWYLEPITMSESMGVS